MLWENCWAPLYDNESKSRAIIDNITDTYYLVNLVDNDYVQGSCLFKVINDVFVKLGKRPIPGVQISNPK